MQDSPGLKRPIVLVVLVVGLLFGLLGWRVRVERQKSHTPSGGSATVEGVETLIGARTQGRVTDVLVREGDRVKPGQVVVRIDCADNDAALALAIARQDSAEAQIGVLEAQIGSANDFTAVANAQAAAIRAQAHVLAIEQETSANDRARAEKLVKTGSAPSIELEKTDERLRGVNEQIHVLEANRNAADLGTRAQSANVQVVKANLGVVRAQVAASRAEVARARLAVAECIVSAPSDGVVTGRLVEPGAVVATGTRLLVTVSVDPARVTFFLPDAELARASVGAPADVRVDAYPGRVFRGTVRRVAQEAEFTPRNVQTREDRDRLVYAVEIEVPNADNALRAGMPADVSLPGTAR